MEGKQKQRECGRIELILGPMFSGKSTELQRRIRRFTIAKKSCTVVKYRFDTRYAEDEMATHDKHLIKALPAIRLQDIYTQLTDYEVIGIDEGQFFPDVGPGWTLWVGR
jgi:thymidine kinase